MFNKYYVKYQSQKSGALSRGIEWKLTFREWRDWWGDDIDKRGRSANQLQMQRKNDSGAYALGNITKGTPKENAATAIEMANKRRQELAKTDYFSKPIHRPVVSEGIGDPIEELDEVVESWYEPYDDGRVRLHGICI